MKTKNETEKHETAANIIAEMRKASTEVCEYGSYCLGGYANRLEAALKRERESVTKCNGFGNAAAIYAALVKIHDKVNSLDEECGVDPVEIRDLARAALSKPARNCDMFADELDAQLAFLNEVWLISVGRETMLERDKYKNWTDEMRTRYGRWLLAEAEEKGAEDDSV